MELGGKSPPPTVKTPIRAHPCPQLYAATQYGSQVRANSTTWCIHVPANWRNFFLEKCVFFTGVPSEIVRDNAKYFNNKFVTTLCNLAVISTHESVIYDHKTNGRAEGAVKSIVETLRVYLQETNTPTSQWYWKLPMALWGLNDLQGAIAPYSPHRLLFGRDPIGFGDLPPIVDENGYDSFLYAPQTL